MLRASLVASAMVFAIIAPGCDSLARSQGKFPVASAFGPTAIAAYGEPSDPRLYATPMDVRDGKPVPLVRIAYRSPWDGDVINTPDAKTGWSAESYYMVIDVTNAIKHPSFGTSTPAEYRAKLALIAEMLLTAADWNGEVYWRHLTTFLETYDALDAAARAAFGASIAGAFISPVLGASLAGGALLVDTFVGEYTSNLNVDEYAALRDAASTYRQKLKGEILQSIEAARPGSTAFNTVLHKSYDYAFTYSIKGAIHAAQQQNAQLKNLLISGESSWKQYFKDEIDGHLKQKLRENPSSGHLEGLKKEMQSEDRQRLNEMEASERESARQPSPLPPDATPPVGSPSDDA
ncbi:MAG: hypothetical protein JNL80_00690 [Phycisphaerae bacterium]|nr:hypothetical protein [Phycisphaerae bacterium]